MLVYRLFERARASSLLVALFFLAGSSPVIPKLFRHNLSVPSLVCLVEACKLSLVLVFLWLYPLFINAFHEHVSSTSSAAPHEPVRRRDLLKGLGASWRFGIIAIVYVCVNNLKLFALMILDTGTFILLNNLSIPMAAILFRIFMRRKLTTYQYCALVVLVTGLVTSKLYAFSAAQHHLVVVHDVNHTVTTTPLQQQQQQHAPNFLLGVLIMLIAAFASAAGDVGAEFSFKTGANKQHFVAQSIILYSFGTLLNLILLLIVNWQRLAEEYSFILELGHGWIIVFSQASLGILIGLVFRFSVGGNITKIFADAGALLFTLCLAAILLGEYPSLDMICGLVAIYTGIFIYSSEGPECEKLNQGLHLHVDEGEKTG